VLDDPAEVPVQRGVAILEDELNAPAQHPQFGRWQSGDVVAIETNCPAGRRSIRRRTVRSAVEFPQPLSPTKPN
jgi:hypothetical protein